MPVRASREYRDMTLAVAEVKDDETRKVVNGYATVFNAPYVLYHDEDMEIREQVAPGAFDECDLADVIMQYNHEGRVFARVSNGTLRVEQDEKGLFTEADLGGTDLGSNVYDEIRGGYTNKMSYGYVVPTGGDSWNDYEEEGRRIYIRTIEKVGKVYDVSAVSVPANNATSISVRNLTDGVIEKVKAERLAAQKLEEARKRTATRARAIGGK